MTTKELLNGFTREEGIALFNEKKTDKEIYDILVSKGLTDDFETFAAEAQKLFTEKVSSMSKSELLAQIEGAELTDDQLEQIAGGSKEVSDTTITIVAAGSTVVGTVIGASAAAAA